MKKGIQFLYPGRKFPDHTIQLYIEWCYYLKLNLEISQISKVYGILWLYKLYTPFNVANIYPTLLPCDFRYKLLSEPSLWENL